MPEPNFVKCRARAAQVIAQVMRGAALDEPLRSALSQTPAADRALLQQLCYGTLRHYVRFDAVLRRMLQKPLPKKDADIHALLLCGMHQLFDMRTPDHAAISSTVEACRALRKSWATKLVNGVLRRCTRERDGLPDGPQPRKFGELQAWESASHSRWLFDLIGESWPEQADKIIEANNQHPPMCLRVNRLKTDRSRYLEMLADNDIDARPCELAADGIRLQRPVDVSRLPGFADGLVSVQDEGAQLAAELLQLPAGARVLDACAAPGGKTCHLLERNTDIETFHAMDIDEQRLERVRENITRLGLHCELLLGDGRAPPLATGSIDAVLLDVPCSGTGVIRRHPDIHLLRRQEDIASFARTQLKLLRGLWPLLRPGGELLYVTCSVLPEENSEVVREFLSDEASARLRALPVEWGEETEAGRQLLPMVDGPDGLFFASIVKAG